MSVEERYEFWNNDLDHGLWLILSNAALVPVIYLSARHGKMTKVLIASYTLLASVNYHANRAFRFHPMAFRLARIFDYLAVYALILWILTSLGLRHQQLEYHIFLFFLFAFPTWIVVLAELPAFWLPLFGVALPALLMIGYSFHTGNRIFHNKPWTILTFLLVAAAGIFMFILPDRSYWWAHSLWHMLAMLAAWTEEIAVDEHSIDSHHYRLEMAAARVTAAAAAAATAAAAASASEQQQRYSAPLAAAAAAVTAVAAPFELPLGADADTGRSTAKRKRDRKSGAAAAATASAADSEEWTL